MSQKEAGYNVDLVQGWEEVKSGVESFVRYQDPSFVEKLLSYEMRVESVFKETKNPIDEAMYPGLSTIGRDLEMKARQGVGVEEIMARMMYSELLFNGGTEKSNPDELLADMFSPDADNWVPFSTKVLNRLISTIDKYQESDITNIDDFDDFMKKSKIMDKKFEVDKMRNILAEAMAIDMCRGENPVNLDEWWVEGDMVDPEVRAKIKGRLIDKGLGQSEFDFHKVEGMEDVEDVREMVERIESGEDVITLKQDIFLAIDEWVGDVDSDNQDEDEIRRYEQRLFQAEVLQREVDLKSRKGSINQVLKIMEGRGVKWRYMLNETDEAKSEKRKQLVDLLFEQQELDQGSLEEILNTNYVDLNVLKDEAMLLPWMFAKITGRMSNLREMVLDRIMSMDDIEIGQNKYDDSVWEMSYRMSDLYGSGSVVMEDLKSIMGATDTPSMYYVRLSEEEREEIRGLEKKEIKVKLIEAIRTARGTVGMGHGFGANKRVWRESAGKILGEVGEKTDKWDFSQRMVGLAFSTKGAEGTYIIDESKKGNEKYVSGHMDRASLQIAESLMAMGMVGKDLDKLVTWIGHSMGGQEALWLGVYGQKEWNVSTIALTPVSSDEKDSRKLMKRAGTMIGLIMAIPETMAKLTLLSGRKLGIVRKVMEDRLATGELKELGIDGLSEEHLYEMIYEMSYVKGCLNGWANDPPLNSRILRMMRRRGSVVKVLNATRDKVLNSVSIRRAFNPETDPNRDSRDVVDPGYGDKYRDMVDQPHYLQNTPTGQEAIRRAVYSYPH